MSLHPVDWCFIIAYLVVAFAVGIYFSKRAGKSMSEFFLAGRTLPWWLAGTSIVATTFAADTPLAVTGLIRKNGLYGNWYWWSAMMGGMLMVFFFAKLWRRAHVLTHAEFYELRYAGRAAAGLRAFGALYDGVFRSCITMGWVMLAMVKVSGALFDLSAVTQAMAAVTGVDIDWGKLLCIAVLVLFALTYTALSGFWGVVMTDLIQFGMAMFGSVALAAIVLWKMGGPAAMVEQIQAAPGFEEKTLRFIPDFTTAGILIGATFFVQITFQWWTKGEGEGYVAQRLFSTRSERDSLLAGLWFIIAHYVLRPWPWIVVGLASLVYFPVAELADPEMAYPMMIVKFLPLGLRGLMVASLLAAFMSTIDTHLNWGASYLINDLYKRFVRPGKSERHYVAAARLAMLALVLCAALAAWQAKSIRSLWFYIIVLHAGVGILGLVRWYWWRVNAWSEVAAMAGTLVLANGNFICKALAALGLFPVSAMPQVDWFYSSETYAIRLCLIIIISGALWLLVTRLTRPVDPVHLDRFYRQVHPGGWWGPVARRCPEVTPDRARGYWIPWFAGVACTYCAIFGVGFLCLGRYLGGTAYLIGVFVFGWIMLTTAPTEADERT